MSEHSSHPPILDDLPSPEDKLGFEPYVLALSDILLDPNTHTPLTLGLFGSWGSGKTSLMRQMQRAVETDDASGKTRYRTVWFNAWRYNQEQTLWRALLSMLLDDLEKLLKEKRTSQAEELAVQSLDNAHTSDPSPEQLLDLLREALYRDTAWSEKGERRVNWTDLVTGAGGVATSLLLTGPWQAAVAAMFDPKTVEEAKKEFGKGTPASNFGKIIGAFRREELVHHQAQLSYLEQFQDNFARLVEILLQPVGNDPQRLVVFVDDLDRCLPEKAIEVLEAIKLFLDVKGCIFVLALDSEAIEGTIRRRYQGEVKAREYLAKIVQVQFRLPPIEAEQMRLYVESLVPSFPDARCNEVFAVAVGANPRQVKRAINVFLMLMRIIDRRTALHEAINPVRLAKVVAIQHTHPELYDLITAVPGYLSDLENYLREDRRGARPERKGRVQIELAPALAQFASSPGLDQIFLCVATEDASFANQKPEALRPYITLVRQAAPIEASPIPVARLSFEPEMRDVPAGEFQMGTNPEDIETILERFDWAITAKEKGWFDYEAPRHPVWLADYEIGRYPVLNIEYAEYVRATGIQAPSHWPGGNLPEKLADHPVVNVTWHDALGYVQWLAERTGKPYRLPTEAEWEKAARGQDSRLWPWGNDWEPALVNCKPAGPGRTTPRGQYSPAGDSPYGCADMAGNVWEWCSSLWGDDVNKPWSYPYRGNDGRESLSKGRLRIMRGGCFLDDSPGIVRCAFRYWFYPNLRADGNGFRVAKGPLK